MMSCCLMAMMVCWVVTGGSGGGGICDGSDVIVEGEDEEDEDELEDDELLDDELLPVSVSWYISPPPPEVSWVAVTLKGEPVSPEPWLLDEQRELLSSSQTKANQALVVIISAVWAV